MLQCLHLDTPLLKLQNAKKPYGTKNLRTCKVGANSEPKDNTKMKKPYCQIKIARRNITSDMQMMPPLKQKSKEDLKSLLMKVKEEGEKAGLKFTIQKTKVMASRSITSWQIDGETMETMTGFIFLGSKITADGDCSHEINRCLLLGRKAITKLDSVLKSRDITLLTKICIVKAMIFPVVTYRCESWTIKKAEC